jgi:hypothetical protein
MEELFRKYIKFDKNFNGLFDCHLLIKAGMKKKSDFYKIESWYVKNKNITETILKENNIDIKVKEEKTIEIKRQVNPPIEVYSKPKNTMKYNKNSYALIFDR